ncbi:ferredoxin domain-containing protein [Anaerotignum sp. MB30-C6]|uniref:ferredoxin domain-containing protein n=1 Tax=Anaerotignum sp. MB30-C6 TaxID=3070814 RepID=UPI0027DC294A|nr:DUF2148 domain-containing protein [Anaerotignum sp. MB30-C6]WMI80742.1 DUF2148 domain-containing protein [Anaerotignum sp. MB30-C6]
MKYSGEKIQLRAIETVASLMIAAAKTAPKACGVDSMETFIIDGADKDALASAMRKIGEETRQPFYIRDADNLDLSACVVLFGAQDTYRGLPHCGYCGAGNCFGANKSGAHCAFAVGDLGIAMGSAVSVAAAHHIDNRVMFSAGKAALTLGLFSEKVFLAYAIPLSVSEKSPFYDRPATPPASAAPAPAAPACNAK